MRSKRPCLHTTYMVGLRWTPPMRSSEWLVHGLAADTMAPGELSRGTALGQTLYPHSVLAMTASNPAVEESIRCDKPLGRAKHRTGVAPWCSCCNGLSERHHDLSRAWMGGKLVF